MMKLRLGIITSLIFTLTCFSNSYSQVIEVCVRKKTNFDEETLNVLEQAIKIVKKTVNDKNFQKRIQNANFYNTKNLSNSEILDLLIRGKEVHYSLPNDTLDFFLEVYEGNKGDNIGSTFGAKRISTNRHYILSMGAKCYASHLIHEYIHTLGFTHKHRVVFKKNRWKKCRSVPYTIGNIAKSIIDINTCNSECESYHNWED